MSEEFFDENAPAGEPAATPAEVPAEDNFSALTAAMEEAAPNSRYITLRVETGDPIFVLLGDEEEGITIANAFERRHLTAGASIQANVEGVSVPLSTFVPEGTVVTIIGTLKGG